jgi:hypothetical protein
VFDHEKWISFCWLWSRLFRVTIWPAIQRSVDARGGGNFPNLSVVVVVVEEEEETENKGHSISRLRTSQRDEIVYLSHCVAAKLQLHQGCQMVLFSNQKSHFG